MENQYLLLVSVLLGMTVGAVVYGVAAKIVSIWSGEPEATGDARRDSLLFLILRPIAKRIENSKGDAKELAECRRLLDAAGPFWGGMNAAEVLADVANIQNVFVSHFSVLLSARPCDA